MKKEQKRRGGGGGGGRKRGKVEAAIFRHTDKGPKLVTRVLGPLCLHRELHNNHRKTLI